MILLVIFYEICVILFFMFEYLGCFKIGVCFFYIFIFKIVVIILVDLCDVMIF